MKKPCIPHKPRNIFLPGDQVTHAKHGICTILREWGSIIGCPACSRLIGNVMAKTPCCTVKTIEVNCAGIFEFSCRNGKTRDAHHRHLKAS